MEYANLILDTIVLRPYVFVFLAAFPFGASRLIDWPRAIFFLAITFAVAFVRVLLHSHRYPLRLVLLYRFNGGAGIVYRRTPHGFALVSFSMLAIAWRWLLSCPP